MKLDTLLQLITIALLGGMISLYTLRHKVSIRSGKRAVILDSCGLIDGRIIDLAQSGFIPEKIIIPGFILKELQYLADGPDAHKRERARFGLDCAKGLTGLAQVDVEIDKRTFTQKQHVDDKLIALAQASGAQLYTTDFNLMKVAEVEGVSVLNVNELAQKLRPTILPGEKMTVKIVQKGSGQGQGVGYAEDGTMVVVERTDKMIGKSVGVVVDRMIGTLAGKMIFARPDAPLKQSGPAKKSYATKKKTAVVRDEGQFVSDLMKELR